MLCHATSSISELPSHCVVMTAVNKVTGLISNIKGI